MFKKAIIATAVLAASTGLAFANGGTYQPAPHATHSAYVGVAVSRDFLTLDQDHKRHNLGSTDLGSDGWNGELNAGLGWVFQDHYYLGAEIFGTVSSAEIKSNAAVDGISANSKFEYKYSYGIDFVPGVKISDSTMLYGKVGYVRGEFDTRANATVFGQTFSAKQDKGLNGLQLGIGLETMITNNVSTKIEYDWNNYEKINGVRPNVDSVKLGVAYHFMSA